MSTLLVATDGGARPNPGKAASGWVCENGTYHGFGYREATNNIGELNAIIMALRDHSLVDDLTIIYDSQYAWKCFTEWGPNWSDKQKRTKKNVDLIEEGMRLFSERAAHDQITNGLWIKGHAASPNTLEGKLNAQVDRLCTKIIVTSTVGDVRGENIATY